MPITSEEQLIRLIKFGTMKKIREIVNHNPSMDLHYPSRKLSTPLTTAIDRSDPMIVSFLIDKLPCNLDSTLTQPCGKTALMHAAYYAKNPEVLSVLMKKGADADKRDINGWNCLFYAVIGKQLKNVAALLDCKQLSIEAKDGEGRTPLMISVYLSSYEVFSYLLTRNAELNAIDDHGLSALHLAIIRRRRDCVIALSNQNNPVIKVDRRAAPFSEISCQRLREEIMLDMLPTRRKACDDCRSVNDSD